MVGTRKKETQLELQAEIAWLRQRVAELERVHEIHKRPGEVHTHTYESQLLYEAVQTLQTVEQNYRLLADNITEMVSRHKSDGTFISVSAACHTLLGYTQKELIGRNCYDMFHPQDLPRIQRWKATILKSLPIYTINYRMRCKNDSYIWIETICKTLYQPNSDVVAEMIAVSHDITQRKNAERKLARTHLMHQATIDSFADGIIVFARNGSIINCNRHFMALWNLSNDWTSIPSPTERLSFLLKQVKDPKTFVRRTRELYDTPEERFECIELKDGRIVECCGTPFWVGNRVTGQVWTFRDVTQRVSNERELHTSRARLKAIFDNVAIGIFMVNAHGHCIKCNDHWSDMLGYAPEEIMHAFYLSFVYSYDVALNRERLSELFHNKVDSFRLETRFVRKDGSVFWGDVSFRATHQDDGTIEAIIGIVSDITERKQAEETLRQTHNQLVQRVHELEQRGREATLLNEMGDLLLSCQTVDEAYEVVAQAATHLFVGYSGALYIFNDTRTHLAITITWGNVPPTIDVIDPHSCCALQQGWAYVSNMTRAVAGCVSISQRVKHAPDTSPFICVPLIGPGSRHFCPIGGVEQQPHLTNNEKVVGQAFAPMQSSNHFCDKCQSKPTSSVYRPWIDQALGVLHLRQHVVRPHNDYERWERLAEMVARNIALALANLHLRAQLHHLSIRDPLTGLFNRRYLDEIVHQEIYRAARHGYPVGIVMLDIDHFKHFNDTYGHEGGDVLLQALANFIVQRVREEDTVCRYGGEEFVLVLSGASLEDTHKRAEELCADVRTLLVQHREVSMATITISLGVAMFPTHGTTATELIRNADIALYRAKLLGRNQVVVSDSTS